MFCYNPVRGRTRSLSVSSNGVSSTIARGCKSIVSLRGRSERPTLKKVGLSHAKKKHGAVKVRVKYVEFCLLKIGKDAYLYRSLGAW